MVQLKVAWDNAEVEYADKLLKIGADPNYRPAFFRNQNTVLHLAALNGTATRNTHCNILQKYYNTPSSRPPRGRGLEISEMYVYILV